MPDAPEKTPPAQERSWLMPILGSAAATLLAFAGFAWWQTRNDSPTTPAEPPPVATAEKPEPPAKVEATIASATIASTTTTPTKCTFLSETRPKVGEKYILQCAQGQFTATGTYTVDHFVWSDFEEYPEPK